MIGERVRMEREFEDLALPDVPQFQAAAGLLIPHYEAEVAAGDLRNKIVEVAEREWVRWNRGQLTEKDPKALKRLKEYYTAVTPRTKDNLGDPTWHSKNSWSAVFVSYVMKTAGLSKKAFLRTRMHHYYVRAAKKARKKRISNAFWAYPITEVAPEPGDIICNARAGSGLTYKNVDTVDGLAHGDIVTEVQQKPGYPGYVVVIGGNTEQTFPANPKKLVVNTVGKKQVDIDRRGLVVQRSVNPFFAIVKVGGPGVTGAEPARPWTEPVLSTVQHLLQRGRWAAALTTAILSGERDVNRLTNLIFFFRHPELKGRKIQPGETKLAREWKEILDRLVVPTLNRLDRAPP